MSLGEFIKEIYLKLLEQSWTLNDIDEMDFFFYLDLLIYKENRKETEGMVYADNLF